MIGQILRKDWRLLWPLVALVTLIQGCLEWAWYRYGFFGEDRAARELVGPLSLAWYAGICSLAIAVVQQDAVPSLDQDWLIRPLRRTDLLAAKLLFIVAAVCLPMLALDVARALATGFAPAASLEEAIVKEAIVALWLLVPVAALSALASTLTELMILGAALIGIYAVTLSLSALIGGSGSCPTCDTGVVWLEQLMQHVGVLLGAGVILAFQYLRRWTRWSRALAVLGVLALVLVRLPWNLAFAAQSWLSPAPGAAASVEIAFDPQRPVALRDATPAGRPPTAGQAARAWLAGDIDAAARYLKRRDPRNAPLRIDLPVRISGLAAEELVLVDRSQLQLFEADGVRGDALYRGVNAGALEQQRGSTFGPTLGEQAVYVPAQAYRLAADRSVRLRLLYSLTLMRLASERRIAALNGELRATDIGRCATKLSEDRLSIALRCQKLGPQPYCFSATLFGPRGRHDPEVLECESNYRPNLPGYVNVLQFYGVNVPVRDEFGLARYPIEVGELGQSYLLIKVYAARDHFKRTLVVPRIRLSLAAGR